MKWKYGISFFLFAMIMSAAYYGSYRYTLQKYETQRQELEELAAQDAARLEAVDAAAANIIDTGTKITIESYHITDNSYEEEAVQADREWIGMGREELSAYLEDYLQNPSDEDQDLGLVSFAVVSFSPDQVVLRRTYEMDYIFYLLEEDDYVTVYLKDKTTVYEHTEIRTSSLPDGLREEIMAGKYIKSNEELFSFLENYST